MKDYYAAWGPLVPHPQGESPRLTAVEMSTERERALEEQIARVQREYFDQHGDRREPKECVQCGKQSYEKHAVLRSRGWSPSIRRNGKTVWYCWRCRGVPYCVAITRTYQGNKHGGRKINRRPA